ncbi:MAG: hypothetical protein Q8K18_19395 [Burkholderiales bacterium]|nr:hypothetical protein [Burkholderiales bacterium]
MPSPEFKLLLFGHDTVQCAYYLRADDGSGIDFERLAIDREELRLSKLKEPKVIQLGSEAFLLEPNGSRSGYPFIINNPAFRIEFGEYNVPSFFVTFRSEALWRVGTQALHQRFMSWAESLGFRPDKPEGLSRVDFTFDYGLPVIDFDEDSFVSLSNKDAKHRENGKVQTFQFGRDDIVLRIYNKVAEIKQQSNKVWFYELWGRDSDVWRIEWQVRKDVLRRFGIRTFKDLDDQQGDLLRYLAGEHTTLRVKAEDGNRSRWPLHPLWVDLQEQIKRFNCTGIYREVSEMGVLNERLMRMAISINGYLKRIAAVRCLQHNEDFMPHREALVHLQRMLAQVHDPLDWQQDVQKRIKHMQLGRW